MDKETLCRLIHEAHTDKKRVALYSCAHVPEEILEAAGFVAIRLSHIDDLSNGSGITLPSNLCPVVKECCAALTSDAAAGADLILAESSCDGKKKMYELLDGQEKIYYYQIPQGEDRAYARPLILSEMAYLRRMFCTHFGAQTDDDRLWKAIDLCASKRESVMALAAAQKSDPPAAWGMEVYETLIASREISGQRERTVFLRAETARLKDRPSPVPADNRRILLTGCPMQSVYRKIVGAVERSGGVVVCFENCEFVKSHIRCTDRTAGDPMEALADIYQATACAIMSPNERRFRLLEELTREYRAEGVIDVLLQTCHTYGVEKDRLRRFCAEEDIPYMAVETADTDADAGQLETRIAAFLEML